MRWLWHPRRRCGLVSLCLGAQAWPAPTSPAWACGHHEAGCSPFDELSEFARSVRPNGQVHGTTLIAPSWWRACTFNRWHIVAFRQWRKRRASIVQPRTLGLRFCINSDSERRALPAGSKLSSDNQALMISRASGHSSSNIEYHAVSRFRPFDNM